MSMDLDELVHTIKHIAGQSQIEQRPFVYAHVMSYDPNTHTMRVIVPSMRDDQTGAPLVSGWLPLGSMLVGAGSGVQVYPTGGATTDNPTLGELALVGINERGTGVAAVISLFYTNRQRPPNTALTSQASAGDIVTRHQSGTVQWFHQNGSVEFTLAPDGSVNINVSGSGGVNINSFGTGNIVLSATGAGIHLTSPSIFLEGDVVVTGDLTVDGTATASGVGLTTHHHSDPQGGNTGGPVG